MRASGKTCQVWEAGEGAEEGFVFLLAGREAARPGAEASPSRPSSPDKEHVRRGRGRARCAWRGKPESAKGAAALRPYGVGAGGRKHPKGAMTLDAPGEILIMMISITVQGYGYASFGRP